MLFGDLVTTIFGTEFVVPELALPGEVAMASSPPNLPGCTIVTVAAAAGGLAMSTLPRCRLGCCMEVKWLAYLLVPWFPCGTISFVRQAPSSQVSPPTSSGFATQPRMTLLNSLR